MRKTTWNTIGLTVALASMLGLVVMSPVTVLAGGSSDTSGDGFHCYLFFSLPEGQFAQVMVNDTDSAKVEEEVLKAIDKYVNVEGGTLEATTGSNAVQLPDQSTICTGLEEAGSSTCPCNFGAAYFLSIGVDPSNSQCTTFNIETLLVIIAEDTEGRFAFFRTEAPTFCGSFGTIPNTNDSHFTTLSQQRECRADLLATAQALNIPGVQCAQ